METPREFDVDAWHLAQSENRPRNEQSISSALVWLTVGVMGLNILCLIIFYVDKCA